MSGLSSLAQPACHPKHSLFPRGAGEQMFLSSSSRTWSWPTEYLLRTRGSVIWRHHTCGQFPHRGS